ncbi:HEPACAM family member 2 isoform X2 [Salminus brasiliensis]|uniref:HEPACAM family member 2 isoform X2 n=1 Tax=Salminus brasiliensis TaxID=930266 RepID=UPI003B82E417
MEAIGVAELFLLCAMTGMSGANMELVTMPPVLHGIMGESLHIPVETHFDVKGVNFQLYWFQSSPKHSPSPRPDTALVAYEDGNAIIKLQWKEILIFSPIDFSLTFNQLDEAAEGDYRLEINFFGANKTTEMLIKTVSIIVNVRLSTPVVVKNSEDTLVEDRDNVTLTCIVEKRARAKYQWLKNNKPVELSERHMFSQTNNSLLISPVKKEDIGMYSCVAENSISLARSLAMELSVFYGPYNLEVNSDQGLRIGEVFTVNQGELIFFECLADSNPPNTCVWISRTGNNTEVLMTGPRFEVPSHKLAQPTKFLCRAFNNMTQKQDETHFTLVVANLGKGSEKLQGGSTVSPLAVITVCSLIIILCMLFVFFKKTCHPKRVLMKIYSRPMPEQKGLHRSGHEDATEDFGIYEFVSIPGKMDSKHASCRSLARLDSVKDLHTTIYDVIRHVPETPTLSLLK